jgi:hypothetical protein
MFRQRAFNPAPFGAPACPFVTAILAEKNANQKPSPAETLKFAFSKADVAIERQEQSSVPC